MAEILAGHLSDDSGSGEPPPTRLGFVTRVLFILFCFEIGVVLLILPWTQFWDNNYFFSLTPAWNTVWFSMYLRGGISGLGLVNSWIGLSEAWNLWSESPT